MTEILTREFEFRAESVDAEKREIVGIAVPYGRDADIGGSYVERFAPDSVQDSDAALLYYRHAEPIGKLISAESTPDGWQIRARISQTATGNDALTLARDGVVSQLSVGFEPTDTTTETREDGITVLTRNRVRVHEVSVVPFGAYGSGASITEVRERTNNSTQENNTVTTETTAAPDLTEVRERLDDIERRQSAFVTRDDEPVTDTRSAAEIVKALAKGDETTIRQYNELQQRAYTGGTTADAAITHTGWVGDVTRIIDGSSGVLVSLFQTGTLPEKGLNIEYAVLNTNTLNVDVQANEGDNLPYGKVALTTQTAPVKTIGGYTQLSRQEIERADLPILQRNLDALAIAAGYRLKIIVRNAFNTAITAQASNSVVLGSTLSGATYNNFVSALVDGAVKFDANALTPDALVVSATVYKKLASLNGSDGRPMMSLDGSGANTVGRLNVQALNGSLAGMPVVLDASQTGDLATFVNSRAITVYTSPIVQLQDDNIINLSKDFSVYRYVAVANEIPTGIVPLKLAVS